LQGLLDPNLSGAASEKLKKEPSFSAVLVPFFSFFVFFFQLGALLVPGAMTCLPQRGPE
jgi:hypothetical protein